MISPEVIDAWIQKHGPTVDSVLLRKVLLRCREEGDCFIWTQALNKAGYPRCTLLGNDSQYAHIFAWEAVHGEKPKGLSLRRKCDMRACCNPDHMQLMTRSQQNQYAAKSGAWSGPLRAMRCAQTARRLRGKLDEAKVHEIRTCGLPATTMAKKFNVSVSLVFMVRAHKAWKQVASNASAFNQRA